MQVSSPFRMAEENEPNPINWETVYLILRPLARRIVYAYRVPAWHGQENDVADDIIQETTRKLFEYDLKMQRGEAAQIHALLPMVRVIAYNYVKDMRRRDMRITHVESDDEGIEQVFFHNNDAVNMEDLATDNAHYEMLFTDMAQEIVQFPYKQRLALLVDLANHMSFEEYPTPLQKAFLKVGIQLQDYQPQFPETPQAHNRHTSLVAHAYKRVSNLSCTQKYRESDDDDDTVTY
jgi:DNA-directed RNA polymerase specialized sigma24 family protein